MAFNGSGTYVRPAGQPVVAGTDILDTTFNTLTADLATALTTCVTRDGQSPATANLPMGGFKHTNLAAGSNAGDSVRYEQFASPPAIGGTAPAAGAFTTLSATGQVTSTVATGTAPLVVASTTLVENLHAATSDLAALATTATTATTATNVTGSAIVTGAISSSSPTAGIGYATGAGGTVTQITSITTPVTLNKITGQITTVIAAIAADTIQSFTLNNNNITINDTIIVNFNSNHPRVILDCYISGSGTAVIRLNNPFTTISASDIFYINFSIIKGATS